MEYTLKRSDRLRQNKDIAEADWDRFARDLGPVFFAAVVERGIAKTLIGNPPRRLMKDMCWSPEASEPLRNVHQLIVNGVCWVRNSYIHGEKFIGGPEGQWERDLILVNKTHAVLNAAVAWSDGARE